MKRAITSGLDATTAAKQGLECPCGRCHRPSDPFTPNDLPNFGTGDEGTHLEGRIAATAVRLDQLNRRALAMDAEMRRLHATIHKVLRALESDDMADDDYSPYDDLCAALKPARKR